MSHDHSAPAFARDTKGRPYTVDLHCHMLSRGVERLVAGRPEKLAEPEVALRNQGEPSVRYNAEVMGPAVREKLTDLDIRLANMDAMGVDRQVVSPAPTQYYYWADPDLAEALVRTQNEDIAALCERAPDRLSGLGNIALQHADLSVRQLDHAVKELGLKGVEISTAVNGLELADPAFETFWARADELGALVFIHPLGSSLGERLNRYYLANVIGNPIETTVALSHLIFGGVFDRYSGLKVVAAHGGGYLPTYAGRSDHAWGERTDTHTCREPPSAYLKRIWFDTIVYSPQAVRALVDVVGADHVVVGTDFPYDMGHYDVQGLIAAVPGLSDDERTAILGGNAMRLIGG